MLQTRASLWVSIYADIHTRYNNDVVTFRAAWFEGEVKSRAKGVGPHDQILVVEVANTLVDAAWDDQLYEDPADYRRIIMYVRVRVRVECTSVRTRTRQTTEGSSCML